MFENELIRLRKLSPADHEIYHAWRNDLEVMVSTSPSLDVYMPEETEQFIAMIASQSDAKGYIIERKMDNKPVGIVSLIHIDYKNRAAECVIDIGAKDVWGQGFGTAALTLVMRYAFDELNLYRLYLQVFAFNSKAIGLYEKLGFTQEGKLRHALYRGGAWHDVVLMSILEPEYRKQMK